MKKIGENRVVLIVLSILAFISFIITVIFLLDVYWETTQKQRFLAGLITLVIGRFAVLQYKRVKKKDDPLNPNS